MKRTVVFAAVAALALYLALPAATKPASLPTATPGTLVVALGPPSAGFITGTVSGSTYLHPQGYEVDLARRIAGNLHLKPKFVFASKATVFSSGRKPFDIAFQQALIRAMSPSSIDFTHSYFDANVGVLLSKKATAPRTMIALRHMRTCAQKNTNGLVWIQQLVRPAKNPLILRSAAAAFRAVGLSRCDALVMDTPVLALEKRAHPLAYGPLAAQIATRAQYGAILDKGSKLLPFVNMQIDKLWTSGVIGKLQRKWFGLDFARIPALR